MSARTVGLEDEIIAIDAILSDASWAASESEVEHQIACHEDTLPQFVRILAKHLRAIEAVGEERREQEMDALDAKVESR